MVDVTIKIPTSMDFHFIFSNSSDIKRDKHNGIWYGRSEISKELFWLIREKFESLKNVLNRSLRKLISSLTEYEIFLTVPKFWILNIQFNFDCVDSISVWRSKRCRCIICWNIYNNFSQKILTASQHIDSTASTY